MYKDLETILHMYSFWNKVSSKYFNKIKFQSEKKDLKKEIMCCYRRNICQQ